MAANHSGNIHFSNPFGSSSSSPARSQATSSILTSSPSIPVGPFQSRSQHQPVFPFDHPYHHQQQQQQAQHHSSSSRLRSPITTVAGVSHRSPATTDRTYLLPTSPMRRSDAGSGRRTPVNQVTRPKILHTSGQRPAALVNASVTYCGKGKIYAFGGFDQFTDEDLETLTWKLVDNYGEIPGVRMGHTASLYKGDKLLIYGGENEHREHLSDIVIFDIPSATWSIPHVLGTIPRGRARHAAVVHDDKLFICGGVAGMEQHVLSDICYLDLRTWVWSRSWRFVPRFDHVARVWGERLWVFGGLGPDTERTGDIWWLDLRNSPAFQSLPDESEDQIMGGTATSGTHTPTRSTYSQHHHSSNGPTTNIANSRTTSSRAIAAPRPIAPGAIGSVQFHAGAQVPTHTIGTHFYTYSSGAILDFITPIGSARPADCSISSFELGSLQWQKLADGTEVFDKLYRWQYCVLNQEGTKAWLLGCPSDASDGIAGGSEESLSDVLAIDLTKYGLVGEDIKTTQKYGTGRIPASDGCAVSNLAAASVDLANMFDKPLESDSMSDFSITALKDDYDGDSESSVSQETSAPINVHKLILFARWPHFKRAYTAQMVEFHSKKMHIPEPYSVVRAFLWYLYTDSIDKHQEYCPSLHEVAGMMVLANIYDMPRLRALCSHRLSREMDVESAATIWERAGVAQDEWLTRRAASFCMTHWGRIVRTQAFKNLPQQSMGELCEAIDIEGRVVGGDELELVGGLGGGKFGVGGIGRGGSSISRRRVSAAATMSDALNEGETEDEEAMEVS